MSSEQPAAPIAPAAPAAALSPWRALYERFRYIACAASGSVIIGVSIPVLLVCWLHSHEVSAPQQHLDKNFIDGLAGLGVLELLAAIFCGPGAVILSVLLFLYMYRKKEYADVHELIKASMIRGAAISFLNFPGLMAGGLVGGEGVMTLIRLVLLFLIAGATCGGWIGWQVYRQAHPGSPFFPRYRLSTLVGLVIAWAALLAIFAPASHR